MRVRDQEARFVNCVGWEVKTTESVLVSWDNSRRASWTVIVGPLDLPVREKLLRGKDKEDGKGAPACS
ncbi:hypothetical protein K523DRAFT_325678 [Schizophyllum commune Tattone D]|nr:hypothetical protein K523DRAFT_325678 [Schizophyllum commune Tattone D]